MIPKSRRFSRQSAEDGDGHGPWASKQLMGVTAKEPMALTRALVPRLQQPGQGKRRFLEMLTQPLAPRGLYDLKEKATCHWESNVGHS